MELVLNNQPSTTSEHPYASQIEALLAAGPVTKLTGQAGSIISIYGNVETAKTIAYFSVETVSYGLVDNDQYVDDCECEYCSVEQSTWLNLLTPIMNLQTQMVTVLDRTRCLKMYF